MLVHQDKKSRQEDANDQRRIGTPHVSAPDSASGPTTRNFAALASANTQPDWILPAGNYSGNRHVNQDQITAANVGQMQTAWTFRIPDDPPIEASPIMWRGRVHVTSEHDDAYAANAKT